MTGMKRFKSFQWRLQNSLVLCNVLVKYSMFANTLFVAQSLFRMLQLFITVLTLIQKVTECGATSDKENEMCVLFKAVISMTHQIRRMVYSMIMTQQNQQNGLQNDRDLVEFDQNSVWSTLPHHQVRRKALKLYSVPSCQSDFKIQPSAHAPFLPYMPDVRASAFTGDCRTQNLEIFDKKKKKIGTTTRLKTLDLD